MLKMMRIILAALSFFGILLLFFDFTGVMHHWLGFWADIQFLPALLALNVGVVLGLVVLTLIVGRVYCSVICPLGILQDIASFFAGKVHKNRFAYKAPKPWLRWGSLGVFALLMVLGVHAVALLVAPYSAFGRMAANLFAPLYRLGNNAAAYLAERLDSYAFYSVDVWIKSIPSFVIAMVSFVAIVVLAWRGGRMWCNTICPVGTILGFLSRFAWFRPSIDTEKCVGCRMCEKQCKASCIHAKTHTIDASRCVACMNCIGACHKGAIAWTHPKKNKITQNADIQTNQNADVQTDQNADIQTNQNADVQTNQNADIQTDQNADVQTDQNADVQTDQNADVQTDQNAAGQTDQNAASPMRRGFLLALSSMAVTSVAAAQDKLTDGGLKPLIPRQAPSRGTPLKPAGSLSLRNFSTRCTGCQLCVSSCPNGVLRPSSSLATLMQPEMSFERGFCRPECTRCSEICPAGAITPVTREEKSSIQIGHAVWIREQCIPVTKGRSCGNCARHCPTGAIQMVPLAQNDDSSRKAPKIPIIDTERCIGCGKCEFVCPARPVSAIVIEGHEKHRVI